MNKGFTFIEIIVAISVMTVGILGIYALVPEAVSIIADNTDRFTAAQLAREAIEVVRNIRDSNWLSNSAWDQDLDAGTNYGAQYNGDSLIAGYGDDFLHLNSSGFYGYGGQFSYSADGADTKFKREVILTDIDSSTLNVKVQIFKGGETLPFFELEENLHSWR